MNDVPLIGREPELALLARALAELEAGASRLLLLAGEAGVGKTRLATQAIAATGVAVFRGAATPGTTPPYGPLTDVFRAYLRLAPDGLAGCGALGPQLAAVLPELGGPQAALERDGIAEAVRCGLRAMTRDRPAVILLDDLQWTDEATLDLLPSMLSALDDGRLLLMGIYRSDEVARGHPLRRLRSSLRHTGRLQELNIEPLDQANTTALLRHILGRPVSPALAAAVYQRTQGVPFFVEELAGALSSGGRLTEGSQGVELDAGHDIPLPETVRDAVLLRMQGVSREAERALEAAAVAGLTFDLDLVLEASGTEAGLEEALSRALIRETAPGRGEFRHALMREAFYSDVPWTRRRALHRQIALRLEAKGAPANLVAEHWLAGREMEGARRALFGWAKACQRVHAYRDAAQALRRALDLWPEGADETGRLAALELLGQCGELSGDLAEASRAWREVAEAPDVVQDAGRCAAVQRQLACVYELQGDWGRAVGARHIAADAYTRAGRPDEAAAERLAAARHLLGAGAFSSGLELADAAVAETAALDRMELRAHALGLRGALRARLGRTAEGLDDLHSALALALEHGFTSTASELYQRIALVHEHAGDYRTARDWFVEAIGYCETRALPSAARFCLACLAVLHWRTGPWDQVITLCRQVLESADPSPAARDIATAMLGLTSGMQGHTRRARPFLLNALADARRRQALPVELMSGWGLALIDDLDGRPEAAAEGWRSLVRRWEQTQDGYYIITPARWAVTFFARLGKGVDARACTSVLARAAMTGHNEALAALGHALGETALLDGEPHQAVDHFLRALRHLEGLGLPYEEAETRWRAGVALGAAGEDRAAIDQLGQAYRMAHRLGAGPLAGVITQELKILGEPLERSLGRRAAARAQYSGLSGREMEVLQLISAGRSRREIGRMLFLSPRTVDMHVQSILNKLDCHSRTQAVLRARELGLLE